MITTAAYADAIELHVPFAPAPREPGAGGRGARHEVLEWLLSEHARSLPAPMSEEETDLLIRDLLTIRRPGAVGIRPGERLLLFDVGSGFNPPSVVRWPMERIALRDPEARLVRINLHHPELPRELGSRGVSVAAGAREAIAAIALALDAA